MAGLGGMIGGSVERRVRMTAEWKLTLETCLGTYTVQKLDEEKVRRREDGKWREGSGRSRSLKMSSTRAGEMELEEYESL
jgi:hypothetical protein